ncbi:cctS, partial [Symbiodinium natans]
APRDFAPRTLRALSKAAKQFGQGQVADGVRAAVAAVCEGTCDGGFSMRALSALCRQRLRLVVALETASVLLEALTVLVLGVVLQELELGDSLPWLGDFDHAALRAVPFALFIFGRCFEQLAHHRRRKLTEQVALALRSRLFQAASRGGPLPSPALKEAVEALTTRCRLRLVAPVLGGALSVAFLVTATSIAAAAGTSMLLLATALEVFLKRRVAKWEHATSKLRRRREALSDTFFFDMKCASATVKIFGWEQLAFGQLAELRSEERRLQDRTQRLQSTASAVQSVAGIWGCLASLALYWLVLGPPSLWRCFQALAACRLLGRQLQQGLGILLIAFPAAAATQALKAPKLPPKQGTLASYKTSRLAVAVEGMRFFWQRGEAAPPSPPKPSGLTAAMKAKKVGNSLSLVDSVTDDASVAERAKRSVQASTGFDLKVLSLQVKRGSQVALVGAAGSGKSTLLAGLAGGCQSELWGEDMEENGILLSGRLAYAPQQPAILTGSSIRENVLFGSVWDTHRYEQVLATSTLSEDLSTMPLGDRSLPDKLSAAALQAMQLARALYMEAEILLLDEPFLHMEPDRAKRALSSLVRKTKDRTLVLATQALSVLGPMDNIVVLRNGTVFEQGDYKTLASMPTEFSRLLLIAKEKDKRSRESTSRGFSCPYICYEVASDPLRELYPLDEEFGTFPTFGSGSVLEAGPRKWVPDSTASSQQPPPPPEPMANQFAPTAVPTGSPGAEDPPPKRLPSASAVPAVGASEAGGFLNRAAESPKEVPELPEEEGIPLPKTSAASREVLGIPGPIAPPRPAEDDDVTSPEAASSPSADGLRRRSAGPVDSEAPSPSPVLRPDADHSAPLPQRLGKPEEDGKAKRRRGEERGERERGKARAPAPAASEMEEKQGFLSYGSRSSSGFERFERLGGRQEVGSLPKGRGNGVLLLLVNSGHASALLVAVLVLGMLANLSVPIVLSYIVAEVPTESSGNTDAGTTTASAMTSTLSETLQSTSRPPPGPVVPSWEPGTTDNSEVVWRGFSSTTEASPIAPTPSTTSTTSATSDVTVSLQGPSEEWSLRSTNHFCAEPDLGQETRPQGNYELDATVGWHWLTKLTLAACQRACEDLADWACRFISWGGPVGSERYCYVHRHCNSMMSVPTYQILEVNLTESPRRLNSWRWAPRALRPLGSPAPGGWPRYARQLLQVQIGDGGMMAWFSENAVKVLLAVLSILLPVLALSQARSAASAALQASHQSSQQQLRALLAGAGPASPASGDGVVMAGNLSKDEDLELASSKQTRYSFLQDVADADHFLPSALPHCALALTQVLAALLCTAAACSRQAVPAVMLTILLASSLYFHHRRLSMVQQLRRFASCSEAAAALRVLHLTECHEVLCLHGHIETIWKEYEAFCQDAALAAIASDAAERWLYSCIHGLVALLLGLLSFSAMTQAQSLPSRLGFAVAAASLAQVALLPDALIELVKHGARLTHGLAALRRMAQTYKETSPEELESPILLETPELEDKRSVITRSGKVALGDVMIENETVGEVATAKPQARGQSVSLAGFPMEKVPGDWPYFGAVEFEKVTVRYGPGFSPALSSCSLVLPAGKALLVVGAQGCGKSSLLKALLRCCHIESGRVVLDAVDVRSVGLSTLRGRVGVVPQELCIFRGTWRQNLDPMREFEEEDLRRVLRLMRLENFTSELDAAVPLQALGPSAVLLCLCRAMLRLLEGRSKLLLLDAATCRLTSTSDADLTAIVLRYCRRRGAAVLQVSRRPQQAPLYDEVAVMATGRVVEQGPAKKLWVKDGALRRVAKDQGLDSSKMTKPDAVAARLMPVWGWEVSPQEDPSFSDEFAVSMKKAGALQGCSGLSASEETQSSEQLLFGTPRRKVEAPREVRSTLESLRCFLETCVQLCHYARRVGKEDKG